MIFVEAFMVSSMLLIGIYCTYTDLKTGIIPNKVVIAGICAGLVSHVLLIILGAWPYYKTWIINMLIADVVSIGMFFAKLWAAGDSKLFISLFFLVPPRLLDDGTLTYSIMPYIYIFIPALLWVFLDSVVRMSRREPRKTRKLEIKDFLYNYIKIVIETMAFSAAFNVIAGDHFAGNAMIVSALILIYAFICANIVLMKKWYIVLLHLMLLLVLWIFSEWTPAIPSWYNYIIIVCAVLFQHFCSMYNYQQIKTSDVKSGMIPAMETVLLFQASRVHSLPVDVSEELSARMTEEEAVAVRRWGNSSSGKESIWIVRKTPFAVMITIGFALWIIIRIVGR